MTEQNNKLEYENRESAKGIGVLALFIMGLVNGFGGKAQRLQKKSSRALESCSPMRRM